MTPKHTMTHLMTTSLDPVRKYAKWKLNGDDHIIVNQI
jgi:hypothetical protein